MSKKKSGDKRIEGVVLIILMVSGCGGGVSSRYQTYTMERILEETAKQHSRTLTRVENKGWQRWETEGLGCKIIEPKNFIPGIHTEAELEITLRHTDWVGGDLGEKYFSTKELALAATETKQDVWKHTDFVIMSLDTGQSASGSFVVTHDIRREDLNDTTAW